ncbi:MAG: BrnA antitoxin family protein [Desulfovibrio sp.]|nr:BrnA antitoxin family protein [Desulfovibrio sp.]
MTLRLDADVLEWFKYHHPKYQSAINAALREYVSTH